MMTTDQTQVQKWLEQTRQSRQQLEQFLSSESSEEPKREIAIALGHIAGAEQHMQYLVQQTSGKQSVGAGR